MGVKRKIARCASRDLPQLRRHLLIYAGLTPVGVIAVFPVLRAAAPSAET